MVRPYEEKMASSRSGPGRKERETRRYTRLRRLGDYSEPPPKRRMTIPVEIQ